jgi:hypothetical protein
LREAKGNLIEILKADSDFLNSVYIIDYSLLLGEIICEDIEELREMLKKDQNLSRGVYVTDCGKAYIVGVIDPLTGFTAIKTLEYRLKSIKYGTRISCVPPKIYSQRFQKFMEEIFDCNERVKIAIDCSKELLLPPIEV